MPCCKCCCGNKDCGEGEQGKCCCNGDCCQVGEYCCAGVCQPDPCGCQDNADCGCSEEGATYYPELEALYPGNGCCPDGTFYDSETQQCWNGNPGSEAAVVPNLCCCDGVCDSCPTLCVYEAEDDCGHMVWNWSSGGGEGLCYDAGGTYYIGTAHVTIPSYTYDNSNNCDNPQTQPSVEVDPCTGVEALSFSAQSKKAAPVESIPAAGTGTELKKLLSKIGIKSTPSCSCNKRAAEMDRQGIAWCEQNVETICDWLQEESTKRKLPFVRLAGKALIYMAIRRAKRGNSQ